MKIDRTRFLGLVTALAATTAVAIVATPGCKTKATDTDDAGSASNIDSGSTSGDGSTSNDASDGAAACLGGGSVDAGLICGPTAEGVPDDAGQVKCAAQCSDAVAKYKSEVAKSISDCIDREPSCEGDSNGLHKECIGAAVAKACVDPAAETECKTLVGACSDAYGTVTQSECVQAMSSLSSDAKTTFTACMTEGVDCSGCIHQVTDFLQ